MGVRSRLANWFRWAGERLDPSPAPGSAKLPEVPMADVRPAAAAMETPSGAWQGVRDRALAKSLATLRIEALVAIGALHAAHTAGAAVFDDRRLAAAVAQRSGEAVPEEVLDKLAQASSLWHRDAAALGLALNAVGAVEVPDLTVADALDVDDEEGQALAGMVEGYEVELSRQMLQESSGERSDD